MKSKTTVLILCVLLGYLGIHRFYVGKNKSGVLYLLTGGLCGIGWLVDIILICTNKFTGIAAPQAVPQQIPTQALQPQTPPQAVQAPQPMPVRVPMPCFLPITDGYGLKYEYQNNLYMINTTATELNVKLGGEITFKQEPENPNDKNAVAILQDGCKIGYIYKGQIQEMANRWLKNNNPLLGFICQVDIVQNVIKYKIGFYKPLEEMQKEKFTLTGIRQKDSLGDLRQDNLEYCKEGEPLTIKKDYETEKYIVSGSSGEIGTLPKKVEDFLNSKDSAIGVLTKVNSDGEGKYTAEVEVYI